MLSSVIPKLRNLNQLLRSYLQPPNQQSEDEEKEVQNQPIPTYILNPKALSINELYGVFDELSHEWTEGLVGNLVKSLIAEYNSRSKNGNNEPSNTNSSSSWDLEMKWIIFDGPVDALWVENMNSVLDDNKMLCLANGERMSLTPDIR